jgi:CheY-like chemotaxis protein
MPESPRVLVVDNDENESARLTETLRRSGFDPVSTWSGLEALELLTSQNFNLLLVSSYLPDLFIGDFLARVRTLPSPPCSLVIQENRSSAAKPKRGRNPGAPTGNDDEQPVFASTVAEEG